MFNDSGVTWPPGARDTALGALWNAEDGSYTLQMLSLQSLRKGLVSSPRRYRYHCSKRNVDKLFSHVCAWE